MDRRRALALVALLLVAACGRSARTTATATTAPPTSTSTTTTSAPTTTTVPTTTTSASPTTTTVPAPTTTSAPAPGASTALVEELADTGGATKVITLDAPSWSSTTATMVLWQRGAGGWQVAAGPWTANVGYGGWAWEPGEATGRTPVGSFTFGVGFGTGADPGYSLGWFTIDDTDYWVEDPASPDYNTHQHGPVDPSAAPWGHFEHLADYPVQYQDAALINFNVPAHGAVGSGIFLHAAHTGATAGCVSLPVDELLTALRWIDGSTRIVMAPDDTIRSL